MPSGNEEIKSNPLCATLWAFDETPVVPLGRPLQSRNVYFVLLDTPSCWARATVMDRIAQPDIYPSKRSHTGGFHDHFVTQH